MKIAHECPLFLLEESRSFCDYDYGLVHLLDQYPEYYAFFVESLKMGREVILDNSVFELETAFDPEAFAAAVENLLKDSKADPQLLTYIIPDVLDDGPATVANAKAFIKKYKKLPGRKMSVAQGKIILELQNCYRDLFPLVDKIGVSFNCKAYETWFETMQPEMPKLQQWVHGRQYFIETLFHAGWLSTEKPMHLLGIALPNEYGYYIHEHAELGKFIDSADTSNPIVHGMLGIRYNPLYGLEDKKSLKLADMIDSDKSSCDLNTIRFNIKVFRALNHLKPTSGEAAVNQLNNTIISVGKTTHE
jgi:hypothetical protein